MKKAFLLFALILMSLCLFVSCNNTEEKPSETEAQGSETETVGHTPRPEPEHAHSFEEGYNYNATDHWQDPTCGCGSEIITPEAHHFEPTDIIEPTFDYGGYTEYTCTMCGYVKQADETAKLTHSFSSEWTFDDKSHWNVCTDEGYEGLIANSGEHVMKDEIIEDSTPEKTGKSKHSCEICGYSYETEIPRKTHIVSLPEVADGTYYVGQSLSDLKLVGGEGSVSGKFAWADPDVKLTASGTYSVVFTPDDKSDAPITSSIAITAEQLKVNVLVGKNGSSATSGTIDVSYGDDLELYFTPDFGYTVSSVLLDGVKASSEANFTLENITQKHTVQVEFDKSSSPVEIQCLLGNDGCYSISGSTLTISGITSDTTYSISGIAIGNIVIDVDEAYKFELELCGFSLTSNAACPISINSGDKVTISAKKSYQNHIIDARPKVSGETVETYPAAIYSLVDLDVEGKGELTVTSANNGGIWTKKDVEVKNLTLNVTAYENSLRGNDSVTVTGGMLTIIATHGDAVKTSNSDVSAKGNQRGNITIMGGTHSIYAAEDAIEAEHDVVIDDTTTSLNIYTDTYSEYSKVTTKKASSKLYIRNDTADYKYSVKYTDTKGNSEWVNAALEINEVIDGKLYYFYSFELKSGYKYATLYIYKPTEEQGQDTNYHLCIEKIPLNKGYDTISLKYKGTSLSYRFINLMSEADGKTTIGEFSSKGIKAGNSVTVWGGTINISSHGDAIRAFNDTVLENGSTATGNITINGGIINIKTYGSAIRADGSLTITNGKTTIQESYIGLEGQFIKITGGRNTVKAISEHLYSTTENGISVADNTLQKK